MCWKYFSLQSQVMGKQFSIICKVQLLYSRSPNAIMILKLEIENKKKISESQYSQTLYFVQFQYEYQEYYWKVFLYLH